MHARYSTQSDSHAHSRYALQVIVKKLSTGARLVLKSNFNHEITKVACILYSACQGTAGVSACDDYQCCDDFML